MDQKTFFQKYEYDIALEESANPFLVAWVSGLMVFFVTLALAASFALSSVTQNWIGALSGTLTVELLPDLTADGTTSVQGQKQLTIYLENLSRLQTAHPAVARVRVLEPDEVEGLIAPWLGRDVPEDMPLPTLVDISLYEVADTEKLKSDIRDLVPGALIDDHADTLSDIRILVSVAQSFVILLTGAIVVLAVVTIAGIVRAKFAVHAREVEVLHLIGAPDSYIARQFRHYTLRGVVKGAILGLCLMILVLAIAKYMTYGIESSLFPSFHLQFWHWVILLFSPVLVGGAIAHIAAHRAVMKELAGLF